MKIFGFRGKMNIVGERLRKLREDTGYKQEQIAAQMQTHEVILGQKAISRIERGTRVVADYELLGFARLYGVRVEWLLTGKGEKKADANSDWEIGE